jgi:hypothetical protein
MSPTARSLSHLRKCGYVADVAERFIAHAGIRRDFLGFVDIIAVSRREPGVLAVQATTLDHVGHRLAKARSRPELKVWLRAGAAFEVWGWFQRAGRWEVKRVAVQPEDLAAVPVQAPARRRRAPRQRELFADIEEMGP